MTTCPLSSFTRKVVLGSVSSTTPSISMLSSFAIVFLGCLKLLTADKRGGIKGVHFNKGYWRCLGDFFA